MIAIMNLQTEQQKGHLVGDAVDWSLGHSSPLRNMHNGINLNLVKGTLSDKVIPL